MQICTPKSRSADHTQQSQNQFSTTLLPFIFAFLFLIFALPLILRAPPSSYPAPRVCRPCITCRLNSPSSPRYPFHSVFSIVNLLCAHISIFHIAANPISHALSRLRYLVALLPRPRPRLLTSSRLGNSIPFPANTPMRPLPPPTPPASSLFTVLAPIASTSALICPHLLPQVTTPMPWTYSVSE